MKRIDVLGQVFGRLTVSRHAYIKKGRHYWECLCSCGNTCTVVAYSLYRGNTRSCGCLRVETTTARRTAHGQKSGAAPTAEYTTWRNMLDRCQKPNGSRRLRYAERGTSVCERWANSFEAFFADMGKKPSPEHSLDRIDNDGDYSKQNCRWATQLEQANNKCNNHLLTYQGRTQSLAMWARELGVKSESLRYRLNQAEGYAAYAVERFG